MNTCVCTFWVRHVLCLTIFSHHYIYGVAILILTPPEPNKHLLRCSETLQEICHGSAHCGSLEEYRSLGVLLRSHHNHVVAGMTGKSVNVGKTIIYCINFINHPQFHHFYRLYAKTIPSHGWFMTLFHPHRIFFKDQLQ
jgi:hypothetical protein